MDLQPLRRMITIAQNHGWIVRDPFVDYSISAESTDRDYLTKDEIRRLLDLKFCRKSMELVRDLYVFCCFTGLSFTDMKNLTKDNLQTSFDGKLWIMTKRQKTGVESNIMFLDIPKQIIDKYDGMARDNLLLPVPTYITACKNIKKIIGLYGIEKEITWHTRRHREFYKHQIINRLCCLSIKEGNDKKTSELLYSTLFCHFKEPLCLLQR